ncbi:plasmodesmata callose-binding protein 3 [Phtheirospermum japonicum]|uniref:Plasmodesmata callose-binding protein 3 n=1 Tax=Phtheirospermum japonicum TaxID=374723 RepID=A0A830B491_9LAMI|nr:plasmodesmata callose-binding protein 3 [Phtheirospermum japonicum]
MAPYDSLPPVSLPENAPPFCVYPPFTPQPPSTNIPSPMGYTPPPPPASSEPILPGPTPIPPSSPYPPATIPSPPGITPNPPTDVPTPTQPVLSPPYYEPSPPYDIPSPSGSVPSPRFLPPVVYPPPTVPPPPHRVPSTALWCVAKASVPDPIIQEAMNYACGSGADCDQLQPSGSCFQPNTLFAHASYAFNSYWQRTKVTGGTCDFGGTAVLVTVDPSKSLFYLSHVMKS